MTFLTPTRCRFCESQISIRLEGQPTEFPYYDTLFSLLFHAIGDVVGLVTERIDGNFQVERLRDGLDAFRSMDLPPKAAKKMTTVRSTRCWWETKIYNNCILYDHKQRVKVWPGPYPPATESIANGGAGGRSRIPAK